MKPLRIGIVDYAHSNWQGGRNYLLNLKSALQQAAPTPPFPFEVVDVPAGASTGGLPERVANRLSVWSGVHQPALHRAIRRAGCDFAYYCATGSRRRVGYGSAHWIADFQSIVAPEFSPPEHRGQSRAYMEGILRDAQQVVLSSQTAREHCAEVFPRFVSRTRVLPFRATTMLSMADRPPVALEGLRQRYGITGPHVIVSNQWWRNKNHACVLRAAEILSDRGSDVNVVCTGEIRDNRDPEYAEEMASQVRRSGGGRSIRVIGKVPVEDLVGLMRHAHAVVQPSLFEGWSTSVEEARCLGKATILSGIAVHREQASPFARYFDPHDPEALADELVRVASDGGDGWDPVGERRATDAYLPLVLEFANAFLRIASDSRES